MQVLSFITSLQKKKIVGADVVELNPKFDVQGMTGHLASRIVAEIIGSV